MPTAELSSKDFSRAKAPISSFGIVDSGLTGKPQTDGEPRSSPGRAADKIIGGQIRRKSENRSRRGHARSSLPNIFPVVNTLLHNKKKIRTSNSDRDVQVNIFFQTNYEIACFDNFFFNDLSNIFLAIKISSFDQHFVNSTEFFYQRKAS